jgi:hypothetical protein
MSTNATPPHWAEGLLRMVLKPGDVESVSGDLLEEYREAIHPRHGPGRADVWYMVQVVGFVVRATRVWGILFGAAAVVRVAMDWYVPPLDFHARATVSTWLGVSLLLAAGFSAASRSASVVAGTVDGVATAAIGALISIVGAASLLAIWHDPQSMLAIQGSGGLGEVFTLPLFIMLPGLVLGTVGGLGAAAGRKLRLP